MDALAGRRRLPFWILTVGVVVVFVVAFVLAYLIGSRPGGLQKAHDARDSCVESGHRRACGARVCDFASSQSVARSDR
jgi:hypothetical protein